MTSRPPFGFVVEGYLEYDSIEQLIRRGVSAPHGTLPVYNARGNGAVRRHLEEMIEQVVRTFHPARIIVVLDYRDAADVSCAQLRKDLQERADAWLANATSHGAFSPLPACVTVVVEMPAFECWLTADADGLTRFAGAGTLLHQYTDVDGDISNHLTWLEGNVPGFNKSREAVALLVKCLHPARMAKRSRSFRKFWKEVLIGYEAWTNDSGMSCVPLD